ncbi:MAG: lipid A deacylase LpxR family protein [Pseudomonadota bacterium]
MIKISRYRCLCVFVLLTLCGCGHIVTVTEENDSFAYGPPTDANYTQGLEILLTQPDAYQPCDNELDDPSSCRPQSAFKRTVNFLNRPFSKAHSSGANRIAVSYGGGQQFYTPDDISVADIIEDDRPYAGYLYGRLVIDNVFAPPAERGEAWEGDYVISKDTRLGIVGPAAFADEVQSWWHDICNCTDPEGWDNQVRNELGVQYTVRRQDRVWMRNIVSEEWQADIVTLSEGSLGNVFTGAGVGGQVRLGYMLPRNFSSLAIARIDSAGSQNGSSPSFADRAPFYAYAFAGAHGQVVLRDIFLDGNTFVDSPHTVDKEYLVGEARFGGVVGWRNWELNILYAHRSDQFELQRQPHRFGQIKITYFPK